MDEREQPSPIEVGRRLQSLRKLKGRTQLDVANALGVSRPALAAIEAGQRRLDARLLTELARAYGAPLSELVREPVARAALHAQFRLPAEMPDASRDELERATASLEALASNYLRLERLLDSPLRSAPVPRYSAEPGRIENDAESAAAAERRRLGLGDGPALKLRQLLEHEAGLRIFHLALPGAIAGLYGLSQEAGPCVAINTNHPHVRQRWSLAHEFGHFLTRLDRAEVTNISAYRRVPEQERFAEQFATAFLLPAAGIEHRIRELQSGGNQLTVADLLLLADEYEVSLQALALRLEGMRVVTAGTWDKLTNSGLNISAASRLLGLQAAPSDTITFPKRYVLLALEAYDRELLTERELADLLGQDRLTVRAIAEQLAARSRDVTDDGEWEVPLSESLHVAL